MNINIQNIKDNHVYILSHMVVIGCGLGAHDFITKPVDLNYLGTVVMVKIINIRS